MARKEKDTSTAAATESLTGVLDMLLDGQKDQRVQLGNVVKQFKYRGFGSLMLVLTLVIMLPTGAIPFVPAISGLLILFISFQILFGYKYPWIPQRLSNLSMSRDKLERGIHKVKPYTQKIDRLLKPRLPYLTHNIVKRITALITIMFATVIILIGFIPLLPATLAIPIFFFGLGYIARDGLLILIGFLSIFISVAGLMTLLNNINSAAGGG